MVIDYLRGSWPRARPPCIKTTGLCPVAEVLVYCLSSDSVVKSLPVGFGPLPWPRLRLLGAAVPSLPGPLKRAVQQIWVLTLDYTTELPGKKSLNFVV